MGDRPLPDRIHILGASGSGTTTLAAAIAAKHGHRHLDTDEFFWLPTDPPFQTPRPRGARLTLLENALAESTAWVLSGSLCGWGDPLITRFQLIVFVAIPTEIRLQRLRAREIARYGRDAIAPGGRLHQAHVAFLEWAARYDVADATERSRTLHDGWLAAIDVPVVRLEGDRPVGAQLAAIEAAVAGGTFPRTKQARSG
jgi:adenylate kinase family enzyme